MPILRLFIGNVIVRLREWHTKPTVARATAADLIVVGPPRYCVTQPGNRFKAQRTWQKAMRTYLAQRKVS